MRIRMLLLSAIFCLLAATPALAGPVAPTVVTLTQPDGVTLEAVPYGDEWANGYETRDGYTIVLDETSGYWRYAESGIDGALVPSELTASIDEPVTLPLHLRDRSNANLSHLSISAVTPAGSVGTKKVLVLLVSFSNRGPVGSTAAQWASLVFGASNSVRDYYLQASFNQLTLSPAAESSGTANDGVVGWLNLGYPHPNTGGSLGDANKSIVRNGILAADSFVNFASFDTNHDGLVSLDELRLIVIAAGYETSYGGAAASCQPNVWGHHSALGGAVTAPTVDGVQIGGAGYSGYSEFGEWDCSSNDNPGHRATMGIIVHEMGHDFGWPDLYDTDNSSEGVGSWDIMGAGSWNFITGGYAGSTPALPGAFDKWYQGWLTPAQIAGTQSVAVEQAENNQRAIQLLNNPGGVDWAFGSHSGTGEYFLVENRQLTGYDAGLPGCGLLIWHIDESVTSSNSANANDSHRLVDLEEADGRGDLDHKTNRGDAGDPYRGTSGNNLFNASSNPNSRLYSGADSGVIVTNISGCSATMSADFTAPGGSGPTATATRTPTRTATSVGPTRTATRTPTATRTTTHGALSWHISLPVIVKDYPYAPPTATATSTPAGGGWATIVSEDFEGSFPAGWQVGHGSAYGDYVWGKRPCRAYGGGFSGWAAGGGGMGSVLPCGSSYPNNVHDYMIYGPFSLVGATAADLTFKLWANTELDYDQVCFVASITGDQFYGHCASGNSQGWVDASLDLANVYTLGSLLGQPNVWVALFFSSDGSLTYTEGAYADNIVVRKCMSGACPAGSTAAAQQNGELRVGDKEIAVGE